MGLAAHVALNLRRSQQRDRVRVGVCGHEQPLCDPGLAAQMEHRELVRALHTAFAEFSRPRREAIQLRLLEGHSYDTVARTLGVPIGTCKTRVHRGLQWLRRRLRDLSLVAILLPRHSTHHPVSGSGATDPSG